MELLEEDKDFPLIKASLGSRTAFREAQIIGATVHHVPRVAVAVINEVEAMADEVLTLVSLPMRKPIGDSK